MEFEHVLCAVDLSDASAPTVAHAAAVAAWYDARLTILHVVPTLDAVVIPPAGLTDAERVLFVMPRDELIRQMERVLSNAARRVEHVEFLVEEGDPASVIGDQALARRADLLVLSTHGRRGFDRWVLGSVAERVVRNAPCPVLTIPPHAAAATRAGAAFTKILCPIDFSPSSLQALGFALALARRAKGQLTMLHVIESLGEDEPPSHAHFDVAEYRRHLVELARTRLQAQVADESISGCDVQQVVTVGRAYAEILRMTAAQEHDLIAMGAQGRSGMALAMFGSTTAHVLRGAHSAVLTLRG